VRVLKVLRQTLEDKIVTISRAQGSLTFPASFQLIGAMNQLQLSARAYHHVLKLARTIADLAGSENIGPSHLAEALQYRPRLMLGYGMVCCSCHYP
jgi:predicted ATPase with chaperone activity